MRNSSKAPRHRASKALGSSVFLDSNELGQFIPLHYHYQMLLDESRLHAFRSAIEATILPGMNVVELGGGTGILSSFAARCGANVLCVEANRELVDCARRLVQSNGLENRIEVIHADGSHFIPPRRIDAVICEMLHVGLLREKQIQVIEAFKKNYQVIDNKTLPRFLPEASRLMFQLVEQPFTFCDYYAPISMFQSPNAESNANTIELSALIDYAHIFYDDPQGTNLAWSGRVRVNRSGELTALRFVTQNAIAIDVASNQLHPWCNQFMILPMESPRQVHVGEEIWIEFQYQAGDSIQQLSRSLAVNQNYRKAA
jgi:type I protein arginine methyltransferase